MFALKIKKSNFALLKLLNSGIDMSTADSGKYLIVNPDGANLVVGVAEFRRDYADRVVSDQPELMQLNKR